MEVLVYEDNTLVPLRDVDKVISMGIQPASAYEKFSSERTVRAGNVSATILSALIGVDAAKGKTIVQELAKSALKKGKTFKNRGSKPSEKEKSPYTDIIKRAITVTKNLPKYIYVSSEVEESLECVLNAADKALFGKVVGVPHEVFVEMVSSGFLDRRLLDRAVQSLFLISK